MKVTDRKYLNRIVEWIDSATESDERCVCDDIDCLITALVRVLLERKGVVCPVGLTVNLKTHCKYGTISQNLSTGFFVRKWIRFRESKLRIPAVWGGFVAERTTASNVLEVGQMKPGSLPVTIPAVTYMDSAGPDLQPYKFSGMESLTRGGLELYDFGARKESLLTCIEQRTKSVNMSNGINKVAGSVAVCLGLLLFFLSCSILQAQDRVTPCQCTTSLDWRFEGYIDVFDSEDASSLISKVRNNMQDEDFLIVEITGRTDSLFRVNIRAALYGMPLPLENVFIRKRHLIILSRSLNKPMPLYSEPSKTSTIILNVEHSYGYVYNVMDCQGDWLKVSFTDDDGICHEGWMSKEYQCPDVYSACMGS